MKKLFFSAVALVAFSSVSMANTIAVEEDSKVNIETFEVQQKADFPFPWSFWQTLKECVGVYNDVRSTYTAVVGSQQATAIAEGAFLGCMGGI